MKLGGGWGLDRERYSLLDNTHGNLDVNVLLLHIFS